MHLNEEKVFPQLVGSDIVLMIPGRLPGGSDGTQMRLADAYAEVNAAHRDPNGDDYIYVIEDSMEEEIAYDFRYRRISAATYESQKKDYDPKAVRKVESKDAWKAPEYDVPQFDRFNLGAVKLRFLPDEDIVGREFADYDVDDAFAVMMMHVHSRCCVFEIYIPKCSDTVHVLEAYRHGRMRVRFPDDPDWMEEAAFFDRLGMSPMGSKRSAVFAYGEPDEQECINCLANEEAPPDGHVAGFLKHKIECEDRAQYSGIRTYASRATLLEIIANDTLDVLRDRMDYQTTELFFVEMLLLRDASTEDIFQKLFRVSELLSEGAISAAEGKNRLEKIHLNLSNAIRFTGTRFYVWPTVQESVRLLSEDFGLTDIEQRYKEAENVIEDKIDALVRRERDAAEAARKKDENTKKNMLIVLTIMGWVTSVEKLMTLITNPTLSVIIAAITVVCFIVIYEIIVWYRKK